MTGLSLENHDPVTSYYKYIDFSSASTRFYMDEDSPNLIPKESEVSVSTLANTIVAN